MLRALFMGVATMLVAATILIGVGNSSHAATAPYVFEPVSAAIATGGNVRLELRLNGPDGKAVPTSRYKVLSVRLDMGPDGMAMMETPLKLVPSARADILAYETEISMAGRWGMTIKAEVTGVAEAVSGTLIFTASKQNAGAANEKPASSEPRKILYYRNPMGLPDTSPVPKKDTMGMDYIPVYEDESSGPDGSIKLSPEKIQRAGVRLETVNERTLIRTVRGAGKVMADESKLATIALRYGGFVEGLMVATTGTVIRAGEPLASIWIESPELLGKQADYLTALSAGNPQRLATAEQNLRLFGISPDTIAQLRKTRTPTRSVLLSAPIAGTILEKPAMVGMNFKVGEPLYRIADLSSVWVMAEFAEQDLGLIHVGQSASLTFPAMAGEKWQGKIDFIYPDINMDTRTGKVRIILPNPDGRLKLSAFARVDVEAPIGAGKVVAVPTSSVLDDGSRRVVFVSRGEGRFSPQPVTLGERTKDYVEIKEGLTPGERVVVAGNFLIDAESNLRAALAAFSKPEVGQ